MHTTVILAQPRVPRLRAAVVYVDEWGLHRASRWIHCFVSGLEVRPPPDPLFSTGQTCAKRPLYNGRIWELRSIVFYWPNKSSKTTIEARGCNTIRRAPRGCHPIRRTSPKVALQESPRVSVHGLYSRISGRKKICEKICFFWLASPYTMGHDWGK